MTEQSLWLRESGSTVGRPAVLSRWEITQAALKIADAEGLEAISMRRVASEIGAGAASIYRHLANRDELIESMIDATAAEYRLEALPTGWPEYPVALGLQAMTIMKKHAWLAQQVLTRATLGPNGLQVLEDFLTALKSHPASSAAKLEAFAMLNAMAALFAINQSPDHDSRAASQAEYLSRLAQAGTHPELSKVFATETPATAVEDRFSRTLTAVLRGALEY